MENFILFCNGVFLSRKSDGLFGHAAAVIKNLIPKRKRLRFL
ncbi:hypothetical protein BSLA_02r2533 [Burkholderia stabilis]|nr:hypothetical protein BSLA_02r2533 [Burkholderia stabilis]